MIVYILVVTMITVSNLGPGFTVATAVFSVKEDCNKAKAIAEETLKKAKANFRTTCQESEIR